MMSSWSNIFSTTSSESNLLVQKIISMQNNVDFSRFSILDEEVLKKTRRLGKYYAYCQIDC